MSIKHSTAQKRLLLRCIHHFKSDLINNMDHMRISGNEPSSVILRQTKRFQKLKMLTRKCQKQAEVKRDKISQNDFLNRRPKFYLGISVWPFCQALDLPCVDLVEGHDNTRKGPWAHHPYQDLSKSIKQFWRRCWKCNQSNRWTADRRCTTHFLMLRPFFPELVVSTDLLSFQHPAVLLFCFHNTSLDPSAPVV